MGGGMCVKRRAGGNENGRPEENEGKRNIIR